MATAKRKSTQSLFRHSAMSAAAQQLFGEVSIVMPPSIGTTIFIAALSLAALVTTTFVVEVPQRSTAIGVLMPASGLTDVVARRPGQVENVLVAAGQDVTDGTVLIVVGDALNQRGESASEANIRSLEAELALLRSAYSQQRDLASYRVSGLEQESAAIEEQRELSKQRQAALAAELAIVEKRLSRWQDLASAGHVSRDAFELEQAGMYRLQAAHAEFQRTILNLSHRLDELSNEQEAQTKQSRLDEIQHEISTGRLQRDIEMARHHLAQLYTIPTRKVVAQVLVQPGDAVRTGQVLARLRHPDDRLQAWLYLPTSNARKLVPGQAVEISLDAYPRQAFGTRKAIVSTVSDTALLPKDVRAPLLLTGPVFEIKAELVASAANAKNQDLSLLPGMSFSAEVIRQRLTLYEWLFRSLTGDVVA